MVDVIALNVANEAASKGDAATLDVLSDVVDLTAEDTERLNNILEDRMHRAEGRKYKTTASTSNSNSNSTSSSSSTTRATLRPQSESVAAGSSQSVRIRKRNKKTTDSSTTGSISFRRAFASIGSIASPSNADARVKIIVDVLNLSVELVSAADLVTDVSILLKM